MTLTEAIVTKDAERCVAEVGLLAYPGCQLAAVHGLTDLFRIASEWTGDGPRPWIRVSHWAPSDETTNARLSCVWDSHPGERHRLDYVIAPPSIVMPEKMQITPTTARWLAEQHQQGTRICSVCAGAFVLAESGLIDGRRVTTHWAFARQLSKKFPQVEVAADNMVLDGGDIITAGGILAWTDLGLTIVERLMGSSIMLATARFLLIDPPRHSQLPFSRFTPPFDHGDEVVLRVQHYIHGQPAAAHTSPNLAAVAGLGERTFLRRFSKSTGIKPTEYIQNVRIAKALEALELTQQAVDQIAWDVGYADPASFRKTFQKLTGLTPSDYRQRFGVAR
ncbi:MAG: GlxA family transcriptional regulator [Pseudomonadota bacterium]